MSEAPESGPGTVKPAASPAELDSRRKALRASLEGARRRHEPPPETSARGNALGMAFRVATEFVAGLMVGGGIGWYLDDWIGSRPLFFLVFLALGATAGIMNVIRSAYRMNAAAAEETEPETSDRSDPAGIAGKSERRN
ncbi:AtpZ/AtpI family protein [Microbaculum marinisediminis]|uniref:AtpZ/AtpI family protein n=1 Tax=Microbaculum marinisediminis TaxID=2931392 RepID=A0AAW5QRQ2_9HYPH|nr:AtpZ/AtpI family protein [Microbaculum sp. A6E488]MCT8970323.1 AtpZ/AtpI family protein [Microbaculum sp. A6E488]